MADVKDLLSEQQINQLAAALVAARLSNLNTKEGWSVETIEWLATGRPRPRPNPPDTNMQRFIDELAENLQDPFRFD